MNTLLARCQHYIFNESIFRRRYTIFKDKSKNLFYIETKKLFTKHYFIDNDDPYYHTFIRKTKDIEKRCYFPSLDSAKRIVNKHKDYKQKKYLVIRPVYID